MDNHRKQIANTVTVTSRSHTGGEISTAIAGKVKSARGARKSAVSRDVTMVPIVTRVTGPRDANNSVRVRYSPYLLCAPTAPNINPPTPPPLTNPIPTPQPPETNT